MTNRASQVGRRVLYTADNEMRATQTARRVLANETAVPVDTRISQVGRRALAFRTAQPATTQVGRRALAAGLLCVSKRCQLWLIQRRDGREFAYTSHDADVEAFGRTFRHCYSLMASASSSRSELGQSGDQSLEGIISDEGISEEDLYGGLFDDAFVQVWLWDWGEDGVPVRRLIAGWVGDTEHGPMGMKLQVMGPAQRLGQNSVTTTVQPGCKWVLGSAECGVDREALKVSGIVSGVTDRGLFEAAFDSGGDLSQYFTNGLVRWTYGSNDGQECEVKTASIGSGAVIELWKLAPLQVEVGDTFELLPGCDKAKDSPNGCSGYANIINFGGYPDVPGQDAMIETPDAKV